MELDYKIETLGRIFAAHAEIASKQHQESIEKFKEAHPDEELTEYLKARFSLAMALSVMCFEIEQLKNQLKGHLKNEHPFL